MALLFDTNILIDMSRGHPRAVAYVLQLRHTPCISVLSIAEFLAGIRHPHEETWLNETIEEWTVYDVDVAIAELAGSFRRHYLRSHGLDMPDALIAATAHTHGLTLITRNAKHFPMLGGKVESPY